jgi:hypothetical protein
MRILKNRKTKNQLSATGVAGPSVVPDQCPFLDRDRYCAVCGDHANGSGDVSGDERWLRRRFCDHGRGRRSYVEVGRSTNLAFSEQFLQIMRGKFT